MKVNQLEVWIWSSLRYDSGAVGDMIVEQLEI